MANGTIDVELLDGFDYHSTVFHSGSSLERVFAIYTMCCKLTQTAWC
ncbi:hypothetical protein ACGFYO_08610 [Streptomyces sp. NPDC048201]